MRSFVLDRGVAASIKILEPESTRTSALAAAALGCSVAKIAKTIGFLFMGSQILHPILVVLSGDKKVSTAKLANFLKAPESSLRRMKAEEVKQVTGFSIGGVPPFPHDPKVRVMVDESIFRFQRVWAAAGSTNAVMAISPEVLTEKLKMELCSVSE